MSTPDNHGGTRPFPDQFISNTPVDIICSVDRLLKGYRIRALAAICSFILFAVFLTAVVLLQRIHFFMLLLLLLSGFLWIGLTSVSRHSLILLKRHIGAKVGQLEFVATQLVFLHFPIRYRKVREEAEIYKQKILNGGTQCP